MNTILRDPLLHCVLIGALIFAYFEWFSPADEGDQATITLSKQSLEAMQQNWLERWRRPPTAAEFESQIAATIRDEVYYREALRLGLDKDDAVVRNRLIQKIRFMHSETVEEPSAEQLQNWFASNSEDYQAPMLFSLRQVYLGRAGERIESAPVLETQADFQALVERLNSANSETVDQIIAQYEQWLSVPASFNGTSAKVLSRQFGQTFVDGLLEAEIGVWHAPIASGFGQHLVRLDSRELGAPLSLSDPSVRQRVENDWRASRLADIEAQRLAEMLDNYSVVVEE